ncbi:MAG: hypothetical protein HY455_00005, partial [Parcubacteria group bacterium]|nr:hypothetical protein [Parcubacteria group bacterium]
MEGELFFNNKRHISSKRSGEMFGYTHDYVSRLCREGKVSGRRIGKTWYAEEDSLRVFLASNGQNGKTKSLRLESRLSPPEVVTKPEFVSPQEEAKQHLQNNSISPVPLESAHHVQISTLMGSAQSEIKVTAPPRGEPAISSSPIPVTITPTTIPSFAIGALLIVSGFVGGHIAFNTTYPTRAYDMMGGVARETERTLVRSAAAFAKKVDASVETGKSFRNDIASAAYESREVLRFGYESARVAMSEEATRKQKEIQATFLDATNNVVAFAEALGDAPSLLVQSFYEIEVETAAVTADISLSDISSTIARTLYESVTSLFSPDPASELTNPDTPKSSPTLVETPPTPPASPKATQDRPILTTPTQTPRPLIITSPQAPTVIERTVERIISGISQADLTNQLQVLENKLTS